MHYSGFEAVFTNQYKKDQEEQNEKEKKCKYNLNKLKTIELSLKSRLDLLQLAIDHQKSFRSLNLLINKAKATADELKNTLCRVETKSEFQQHFISHGTIYKASVVPKKIEHEIDSLDDDELISHSSTRIRDAVSVTTHTTARCPTSQRFRLIFRKQLTTFIFFTPKFHLSHQVRRNHLCFYLNATELSQCCWSLSMPTTRIPILLGYVQQVYSAQLTSKTQAKHLSKKLRNLRQTSRKL